MTGASVKSYLRVGGERKRKHWKGAAGHSWGRQVERGGVPFKTCRAMCLDGGGAALPMTADSVQRWVTITLIAIGTTRITNRLLCHA